MEAQAGNRFVKKLRCSMCTKFTTGIVSRRNFSKHWLVGAEYVQNSNIQDHARYDHDIHAMNLLKREQVKASNAPTCLYTPIVQVVSKISDQEREHLCQKFDMTYFLAIKKLSFRKLPRVCELEDRHEVSIGNLYTEIAGKMFTHYIAQSQWQQVLERLAQAKFFLLLIDGSTEKANMDSEVFMVVWCDTDGIDEKIHTQTSYFRIGRPSTVNAAGFFQNLSIALQKLRCAEEDVEHCTKLVGIGSDGTATNIARRGVKGLF